MDLKRCVKNVAFGLMDSGERTRRVCTQIRQYDDERYRKIYGQIELSDEQRAEVDSLYEGNYGSRVPYTWHRLYMALTSSFDAAYIPETLVIPELDRYMNLKPAYVKVYGDKNVLPLLAAHAGVPMPKTLLSASCGVPKDGAGRELSSKDASVMFGELGECFAKPSVDSAQGDGCRLLDMRGGVDMRTGDGASVVLASLGQDFVVQERVRCHSSLAAIYSDAANTFRVITLRWQGEIVGLPAVLRMGSGGSVVDNASAGGLVLSVDGGGYLGNAACTHAGEWFPSHPDTGFVFAGGCIERFPAIVEAAKAMHREMPQIGMAGWDFTLGVDGSPVLLEVNLDYLGFRLLQMVHGFGVLGELTPEVLRWMRLMRRTSVSERWRYVYGRMPEKD